MTSMVDGHGTDVPLPTLEEVRARRATAPAQEEARPLNPPHPSWCVCGHTGCQEEAPGLFDMPAAVTPERGYHP